MAIDDSFKKPGAIPFKWELKPGLPKNRPTPPLKQFLRPPPNRSESITGPFGSGPRSVSDRWRTEAVSVGCLPASPLLKFKPSTSHKKKDGVSGNETPFRWSVLSRNPSLKHGKSREVSGSFSDPEGNDDDSGSEKRFRWSVSSRKKSTKQHSKSRAREVSVLYSDPDKYVEISDFETPFRSSVSSRKSHVSPSFNSPLSASSSSVWSSSPPRHISDAEWAGFGLF